MRPKKESAEQGLGAGDQGLKPDAHRRLRADRGLRRHRRRADGRAGRARRRHRLALPAESRLAERLRRASSTPTAAAASRCSRPFRFNPRAATCRAPTSSRPRSRPSRDRCACVDAMTLPDDHLDPMRELVRSVEGVSGRVPMRWRCAPRFDYGRAAPRCEWRHGVPVATWRRRGDRRRAAGMRHAGVARRRRRRREFEVAGGGRALLALRSAYAEPLVLPGRAGCRGAAGRRRFASGSSGRARTTTTGRGPISCCAARSR